MKKRNLALTLAMVLALVFAFAITGCNDDSSKTENNYYGDSGSSDTGNNDSNGDVDNNDDQATTNVPTADGVRRCTLCDSGQNIFDTNLWLANQYEGEVIYIVLRAEKITYPRKIYIAGVTNCGLTIHNQRTVANELTPTILANIFGNFYQFDDPENIDPKDSAEIEMVGQMKEMPFLSDLLNPAEVGINAGCGESYSIDENNDESNFPNGALLYKYDPESNKIKYNKRVGDKINTFDCQRNLPNTHPESWSMFPLGPRVATTDGTISGEIINSNPPARTTVVVDDSDSDNGSGTDNNDDDTGTDSGDDGNATFVPYLGNPLNCQNSTYLVDPENQNSQNFQDKIEIGTMFSELNVVNELTGQCKLKLNLKVSEKKIVTIKCWEIFILPGWSQEDGKPVDLNDLNLGVNFSSQYYPKNGGPIDTILIGVVSSTCYSSYTVGSKNWQAYIQELTIFIEVNNLHIDGIHKIKMNVRYGNTVFTFDCLQDIVEYRPWSAAVLADHITGYDLTFQGVPTDAYRTEDTVWVAVSSEKKPSSIH